jgi:hypothetical protein
MLTMTLLSITAVLKVVFAGICLAVVARIRPVRSAAETSWVWITAAFLVSAASGLFQGVWAAFAFAAGPGQPVFEGYLRWLSAMNYSRFGVMIGLGVSLSVLALLPSRPAFTRMSPPLLISATLLLPGILAGYMEGSFESGLHASRLSVLQVVETLALLGALFVAAVRRSMDSWLWLALFVYGFRQAVNALLWAGNAWIEVPGAWHPPVWVDPAIGIGIWLVMIGFAGRRLQLARRGSGATTIFAVPGDAEYGQPASATGIHRTPR